MHPTAIRHLSVALEALARIQGTEDLYHRVYKLLERELYLMEGETTAYNPTPKSPTIKDDEIPF